MPVLAALVLAFLAVDVYLWWRGEETASKWLRDRIARRPLRAAAFALILGLLWSHVVFEWPF